MPNTVFDQENKFKKDEILNKLSQDNKIRYTGFHENGMKIDEIRKRFIQDMNEGYINIAYVESGINLRLCVKSIWKEDDLDNGNIIYDDKISLQSRFILNGVCVIWKGEVSLKSLLGTARIEFDTDMAKEEYEKIRTQLEDYSLIFGCVSNPSNPNSPKSDKSK